MLPSSSSSSPSSSSSQRHKRVIDESTTTKQETNKDVHYDVNENSKNKKQKILLSSPSSSSSPHLTLKTSTLYVGDLHPRISEPHLEKLFQRYGEINRVHIVRRMVSSSTTAISTKMNTGNSSHDNRIEKTDMIHKGKIKQHKQNNVVNESYSFAFVEYKSIKSAMIAMEKLNGVSLLEKTLIVRPSHHGKDDDHRIKMNNNEENNYCCSEGNNHQHKKQRSAIESKIDALKKALKEKEKGV